MASAATVDRVQLLAAKRLVELHGGRIWVESEVGKGEHVQLRDPARPACGGVTRALVAHYGQAATVIHGGEDMVLNAPGRSPQRARIVCEYTAVAGSSGR